MSFSGEPEAEPRRLVPFRGWPPRVAVVGRIIAGVAVFVLVFAGTTWLLSDDAPPAFREARFASAEHWPEIKNGVPELKASPGVPAPQIGDSANGPPEKPDPRTMRSADESVPGAAPVIGGFVHAKPTDGPTAVPADLSPVKEAFETPAGAAGLVSKPEESSRIGVPAGSSDGEPRRDGGVIGAAPQKETGARPKVDDVPAASDAVQTGALAPALLPGTRAEEKRPQAKQQDKTAPREPRRQGSTTPAAASGASQTSSAKARMATKIHGAEVRKKKAGRTRTAAPQPQPAQAPSTVAAAQPSEEQRKRFLGIPLPTGSEVRQCLFELRC
jgi:hypothetical protein